MFGLNTKRGISDGGFLAIIVVILILLWLGGTPEDSKNNSDIGDNDSSSSFWDNNDRDLESSNEVSPASTSKWKGRVRLSRGNARNESSSHKEYIVIRASSFQDEPVNVSGWFLENGSGDRNYQISRNVVRGNTKRIAIPYASKLFLPNQNTQSVPIVLEPGDRAIIVTGGMSVITPFTTSSFKVNKCSGYLENTKNVDFYPNVSLQCPRARDYPEVDEMTENCYDFVKSVNRCHIPEHEDEEGKFDPSAFDGVEGLSNQCKAFINTHLNYTSCLANHINDKDFYDDEWRIFLNQPWQIWAKDRENVRLYDSNGLLVDQLSWH